MAGTGKSYEQLTQRIFSEFLSQNQVNTVDVQHDVTLQGKTAQHQIDVYWEFELQKGIRYVTVMQCKDWSRPVEQGELIKFKGVLDDLPDQPRGIFVTKTGYQSGAREYAKAHGIKLYELRTPVEGDFDVRRLVLEVHLFEPKVHEWNLEFDLQWAREEKIRLGIPADRTIDIEYKFSSGEDSLYDSDARATLTINEVLDSVLRLHSETRTEEMAQAWLRHEFSHPTFAETMNEIVPLIRVKAINALISGTVHHSEIVYDLADVVGFVLKDVLEERQHHFVKTDKL